MPWTQNDAESHTHKATTPELKELWAKVANESLERNGDEGRAIHPMERAQNAALIDHSDARRNTHAPRLVHARIDDSLRSRGADRELADGVHSSPSPAGQQDEARVAATQCH